jgi:large subunit ribosomal protein L35
MAFANLHSIGLSLCGVGAVFMPKKKTNRSAAKRFRITAQGKIRRNQAFVRHILTSKSRKRKRCLRHSALVASVDMQRMQRLILS